MERRQLIIILAVVAFFFLAGLFLMYRQQKGADKPIATAKRLYAKPGTTRQGATIYTRKGPARDVEDTPSSSDGEAAPIAPVKVEGDVTPKSFAENLSDQLLTATLPVEAIDQALAALNTLEATGEAAKIYTTLGLLYMRLNPPDLANAIDAFENARANADTSELECTAAKSEVTILMQTGNREEALRIADETLSSDSTLTKSALDLRIIRAGLLADLGRLDEAETSLKRTMDEAFEAIPSLGADAESAYRHAAFRLARLYRETDRTAQADALAETIQRRISSTAAE